MQLFEYILKVGNATVKGVPPFPSLDEDARGLPYITEADCKGTGCNACAEVCPTDAINIFTDSGEGKITLDLGACIGCGLCVEICPTETIVENKSSEVAVRLREDLILTNDRKLKPAPKQEDAGKASTMFNKSIHARVVSTGCSACDAEIGASTNAVFDIDRFGIHIVASPRYADALLVTGPVSKGMQNALTRCYEAMAEPRAVVAVGTCAISGGVHRGGYAEANGADKILPVDVYIPGCPPHPWSLIHGVMLAMGRVPEGQPVLRKKFGTANGLQKTEQADE